MLAATWPLAPATPAFADIGSGCVSLTSASQITQPFDSLANSGTSTTLPAGVYLDEQSTTDDYAAGTGSSTTGNAYSFGEAGSTDRALGSLNSNTSGEIRYGICFANNTGQTITSLAIAYVGEQWRYGGRTPPTGQTANTPDVLNFQYSPTGSTLTATDFVDANTLDFSSPIITGSPTQATALVLNGNESANRTSLSANVGSLTIANGQTFFVRWVDSNINGSDDGLAIDDFSLTPTLGGVAVDNPPTVQGTVPTTTPPGATGVAVNVDVTVTFSEAVTVTGDWFQLACTISGTRTATSGAVVTPNQTTSPTAFTINPAQDFAPSETCTLTVFATLVTDQDGTPNQMAANYTGSFTVAAPAGQPTLIRAIQGAQQQSPLVNQTVTTVSGIVTALRTDGTGNNANTGFYLQDPTDDGDEKTSEAVFVRMSTNTNPVAVGNAVTVATGTVREFRPGCTNQSSFTDTCGATTSAADNLTVTWLVVASNGDVTVTSSNNSLPAPVVVGSGGRVPPTAKVSDEPNVDAVAGAGFDPAEDGADFYESLEAMRVRVNNAVVVGPNASFGEIAVLADQGAATTGTRTPRGGILYNSYADAQPERIILDDQIVGGGAMPPANVGDTIPLAIGVFDYGFGNFKLQITPDSLAAGTLPRTVGTLQREVTAAQGANQLAVASFNVENLTDGDPPEKFQGLAQTIVQNLKAPDVIVLEEIQDNNGTTGSDVVAANETYAALIGAIAAAPGPTYAYQQIDPQYNTDGGAPVGNIRVGFLYRTDRGLAFVPRGPCATAPTPTPPACATTATTVQNAGGQPQLSLSPGRVEPTNPAWENSRKPLVGEFTYNGRTLFIIANHFASKGGDDPLFGKVQPPVRNSEIQRNQQAAVLNAFIVSILAINPNANVIAAGDFNDFEFSATLNILRTGSADGTGSVELLNLFDKLPPAERYSYVFNGASQILDSLLVSASLFNGASVEYDVVHVNSEFADQQSDHDPSVGRFTLAPADATAPTTTATPTPTAANGQNGFYTSDVLVTLTAADNDGGSGVREIVYSATGAQIIAETTVPGSTATFSITAEGTTTISFFARDNNGNAETAKTLVIKLDKTPPTAQNDQYTAPNGGGALVVPVAQGVLANDAETVSTPLIAQVVTGPTKGQLTLNTDGSFTYTPGQGQTGTDTFTYQARNAAGLTVQATATITLAAITPAETTPPTTTATTLPPAPNAQNGYFANDVVVTLAATDNQGGSGVKEIVYSAAGAQTIAQTTVPGSTTTFQITTDGTTTISYFARDNGGNAEAPKTLVIKLDTTPPTPQNDQYSATGRTLTVPAAQGVLANDTESSGAPLTASHVTGPLVGQLTLNPDGSFTYVAPVGATGSDSFVYRATNAAGWSTEAQVVITQAPFVPAQACNPRPPVRVQATPSNGKLLVTIGSTPQNTQQANPVTELNFSKFLNARVTLNGQQVQAGQRVSVPATSSAMTFTVERVTPGQGTTVEFVVTDACGPYPTFVGGGPNAF